MSKAEEGVDFLLSANRRVAFRTRTVLNSQQLSDFYAGRPVEGGEDVARPIGNPVERWPGYDQQSWSERFAELDRRYRLMADQAAETIMRLVPSLATRPSEEADA